jgi:CRISPR-associated protein Cmr2
MEGVTEELFLAKIGALLHDPPDKPWLLGGHRERAEELAKEVLGDKLYSRVAEGKIEDIVHSSDILDASIDRWLTSTAGLGADKLPNRAVCLLNLLSGDRYYPKEPKGDAVKGFARELGALLSAAGDDLALRYHLLYGLLEPLFYEYCPEAVGPADTRLPTHSVFDHVYATASTVNWTVRSRAGMPSGLLVRVDLGGVQRFVSSSRKLSDFWAGSWLISFVAWRTVEGIVEAVGPDVLIMPTARNNAFYYHLLLRKLKDAGIKGDSYERVMEVAKKYAGYDEDLGMPRHPIIPATIDLILPPLDVLSSFLKEDLRSTEDLANYFLKTYFGVWRSLVEKVEEAVTRDEALRGLLASAIMKLKDQGIDSQPPLLLRIVTVTIPDEVEEMVRGKGGLGRYKVYNEAFKLLLTKALQLGTFKASSLVATEITGWTEEAWRKRKRYAVCSVCSELPAVLEVEHGGARPEERLPRGLGVRFDRGEKLCGYCLIRRLMSSHNVFEAVARDVVRCLGRPKAVSFPSTGDVASIGFKQKVLEAAEKASPEELEELCRLMESYVKGPYVSPATLAYRRLAELVNKAQSCLKDEKARTWLSSFLVSQAEELYLRYEEEAEGRKERDEFRRRVREMVRRVLSEEADMGIYYTILRADADSLGKLLAGSVGEALFPTPSSSLRPQSCYAEVLRRALTDERCIENKDLRSLYLEAFEGNKEGVAKILEGKGVPHAGERALALVELFRIIKEEGKLLVSPTYHATLSRCLMVTAIKDVERVERAGGVVIYAGGDDLLAILPVEAALEAIVETRRCFSDGDFVKGFHKLGGGIFPSAGLASRSYVAIFGHYMFPMSYLLADSYEALEKVAKETARLEPEPQLKKDVAVIKFVARGGGAKAEGVIPLKRIDGGDYASLLELSRDIISKVNRGLFSTSLYYDLAKEFTRGEGRMRLKALRGHPDVLRSVITHIVERNAGPGLERGVREREVEEVADRLYESSRVVIKRPGEEGEVEVFGMEGVISTVLAHHSAVGGRE